jgi:hypothetical protein
MGTTYRHTRPAGTQHHHLLGQVCQLLWVRLNKCTETAIDYDDSKNGRFLCSSSSRKVIDIKTMFLAEKLGCRCFH